MTLEEQLIRTKENVEKQRINAAVASYRYISAVSFDDLEEAMDDENRAEKLISKGSFKILQLEAKIKEQEHGIYINV